MSKVRQTEAGTMIEMSNRPRKTTRNPPTPQPGAGVPGSEGSTRVFARSTPLAEALARVGDRWTLLVVEALLDGPRRFNDLQEVVDGIAPNILSERLKRLERDRLVLARPYSQKPPRAAYELTAEGNELAGALRLLAQWGTRHADETDAPHHVACGTPIEARWYCPTCDRLVDDESDVEVRFV